jgi:hypothetical protein
MNRLRRRNDEGNLALVGFVNSVVADFQGNPEPVASAISAARLLAADKGERLERVHERWPAISQPGLVTGDGEVRSTVPLLLKSSVEPMLRSSERRRAAGRVFRSRPWGEKWSGRRQHDGGHRSLVAPPELRHDSLQIGHGRIYEPYGSLRRRMDRGKGVKSPVQPGRRRRRRPCCP